MILFGLTVCLAACGDLNLRSLASPQAVPATLEGRWVGTWQSSQDQTTGPLEIRIQQFAGQPVVEMEIDNPCLVPNDYDFVMAGGRISLRLHGEAVMEASLLGERQLDGVYACALDDGVWQAEWVGDLPSLLDLSGSWQGRVYSIGQEVEPITMTIEQSVRAGRLVLCAEVEWPAAFSVGVLMEGFVDFAAEQFEITLFTPLGVAPRIYLTGFGERETEAVTAGIVQVQASPLLPLTSGMVQLMRHE